ncbi:MAG TPA: NAD(P)H-dependent oxidoreductase [Pseudonocardiaceae bacterium]|jgi:multimeric flavodoxin WrbA|nr:NAD(P)H-dependent oxidoreductase [Pseudonocardiaceae bacterium]
MTTPLHAVALVCTLTPSPDASSSDLLAGQVLDALAEHDVTGERIRLVDLNIRPGIQLDMGEGDQWPQVRAKLMTADIVLVATPIWLGHASSVAQQALERLDAEISETDDQGRLLTYGKVGIVAVVGNEDGAHKISADLFQALNDVGFTIPAGGVTYWNGEAMHTVDYQDLDETPEQVASTTKTLAANAAHLARLLHTTNYPPS